MPPSLLPPPPPPPPPSPSSTSSSEMTTTIIKTLTFLNSKNKVMGNEESAQLMQGAGVGGNATNPNDPFGTNMMNHHQQHQQQQPPPHPHHPQQQTSIPFSNQNPNHHQPSQNPLKFPSQATSMLNSTIGQLSSSFPNSMKPMNQLINQLNPGSFPGLSGGGGNNVRNGPTNQSQHHPQQQQQQQQPHPQPHHGSATLAQPPQSSQSGSSSGPPVPDVDLSGTGLHELPTTIRAKHLHIDIYINEVEGIPLFFGNTIFFSERYTLKLLNNLNIKGEFSFTISNKKKKKKKKKKNFNVKINCICTKTRKYDIKKLLLNHSWMESFCIHSINEQFFLWNRPMMIMLMFDDRNISLKFRFLHKLNSKSIFSFPPSASNTNQGPQGSLMGPQQQQQQQQQPPQPQVQHQQPGIRQVAPNLMQNSNQVQPSQQSQVNQQQQHQQQQQRNPYRPQTSMMQG
ncbi:hypothetical protein BLOT_010504, partial [Blomia tropicalis]